jgi:glycosyltransferase involved in cell wall biosynthesis
MMPGPTPQPRDLRVTDEMRVLLLVPAKDEAESLPRLLAELASLAPQFDVLVIDDGSEDDTARIAKQGGCTVLRHPFNLGYGAALTTGYRWALRRGYDAVVQVDADGQHPPREIERLLGPLRQDQADVVLGSRYREEDGSRSRYGGSLWRRLAAAGIGLVASVWMRKRITDPTSGFQALNREALELLCHGGFPDDFPDVDVLITMHRCGLRLLEIPTPMRERFAGVSMHGGLRVIFYFYRLFVVLMLLPVRRHSPYRKERKQQQQRLAELRERREQAARLMAIPGGENG